VLTLRLLLVLFVALSGCATRFGKVPLETIAAAGQTPEVQDTPTAMCSWMRVEGLRAYGQGSELYLCCPGSSSPNPVCYQTRWKDRPNAEQ